MQFYANKNRHPLKTFLFFLVVLLLAYLPVASFFFFLKNDAFTGYFPPKFFMSESIHAGHLPLWNPYINFGIPQYGDMSSGYWSPITWLIASTTGYNAYTFTLEVLFYILIGGIGMYRLCSHLKLSRTITVIAAVSFMCCGYNTGHLQHFNWLSGAAFLPWCYLYYHKILHEYKFVTSIKAAIVFYLLLSSAHPGISISAFYFFGAYALLYLLSLKKQSNIKNSISLFTQSHIILLLLLALLCAGMITGYADIMPYFVRSEKISLSDSLLNPTTAQSWISVLFPFATVKNDVLFETDVSMRNNYFSVALLLFLITGLLSKKNRLQYFLLLSGTCFALLSGGGIFKTFAYKFIPFIGYVRLNGEFSIFAIFCFILFAATEMNKYSSREKMFTIKLQWSYYLLEIICFAALAWGLYQAITSKESILYQPEQLSAAHGMSNQLKALLNSISFYDTLWIQAVIQLLVLWGIKWALRYRLWSLLRNIVVADMIIATLLNIPFTGVGKTSVAQVQQLLDKSPRGIPVPALIPISSYDSSSAAEKEMIGDWSMYSKQPGTVTEVAYPIQLKNTKAYFEMTAQQQQSVFKERPFLFFEDSSGNNSITIKEFSPDFIRLNITSSGSNNLILQQSHYPHWHYSYGNTKQPVQLYRSAFMRLETAGGAQQINISFEPSWVKRMMLLSAISFILLLVAIPLLNKRKPTKQLL